MPLTALHHIRQLRGRTHPHLMYCDDGSAYVVKFQANPFGARVLACDYLATKLASWAGFPVPLCSIIEVSDYLFLSTKELSPLAPCKQEIASSRHFASRMVGYPGRYHVFDMLPASYLDEVVNISMFSGMIVIDQWCSNSDWRQAVYLREYGAKRYQVVFIDQSHCFCGPAWEFTAELGTGLADRHVVYSSVAGWDSFEPFLSRIVSASIDTIWGIAREIPLEWCQGDHTAIEMIVESLLRRRSRVHEQIARLRDYKPGLFPKWSYRACVYPPLTKGLSSFPNDLKTAEG